ncbi:hypothetical protein KIN20_030284 [Parelaphostrongylus tenuis]|uniref:Uncharacterized protein n=1 Tax=Parelaphostrongylus tenuis TaxID=148309 RepID=A0AAD5R4K2_PARTN|nr:hypothetical protein KIN20_030284 [Parelaphostrongylus tenuis]
MNEVEEEGTKSEYSAGRCFQLLGRKIGSFDGVEGVCQEFFDLKSKEWYIDQTQNSADRGGKS